jgi:hypothetical protein
MASGWHTQDPASSRGIPLEKEARTLRPQYYAGTRMPSPAGGFLEPLNVRREADGSGVVLLECNASSLRYELGIPKATTKERTAVKRELAEGLHPTCPRHTDPAQRLRRIGDTLVCPLCGVRYGRPE